MTDYRSSMYSTARSAGDIDSYRIAREQLRNSLKKVQAELEATNKSVTKQHNELARLQLKQETEWGTPLKWLGIAVPQDKVGLTGDTKVSDTFSLSPKDIEKYKGCVLTATKADDAASTLRLRLRKGDTYSDFVDATLNGQVLDQLPSPPSQRQDTMLI